MKKTVLSVTAVIYMAGVFVFSTRPGVDMSSINGIDKFTHFMAYLVMGWLLAAAIGSFNIFKKTLQLRHISVTAFLAAFTYGDVIELYQSLLPERTAEILDALANGAGALAGALIWARLARLGREGIETEGKDAY